MPVPVPKKAKRVFDGVLFDTWQWQQKMYDGSYETFECITRTDTASVIPFLDPHTVLLTHQEQPHRPKFIDVPGGRVDPGESPTQTMQRELKEETGYRVGRYTKMTSFKLEGSTRLEIHLFLATDLKNHAKNHLDAGEKITLKPTPWDEAVKLALQQKMRQVHVMLAILSLAYDPKSKKLLRDFLKK